MNLNTTEQNILLSKEAILSMKVLEIENELNDNGKKSFVLLSVIVLAARAVMAKRKNSVLINKYYDEKSRSSFHQDGKMIDEKTISLATDSLTWFGDRSGVPSLHELLNISNDIQHFVNLLQKHIYKGVLLKNRDDKNRDYSDSEIKRLDKIFKSRQECFHKEFEQDKITCRQCDNYETSLRQRGKEIENLKEEHLRVITLEEELFKALYKVPRNLQNPKNKIRTPIYNAKELILLVIKACALSFPNLSYKLLKKIIYKILENYHNSAPIYIEDNRHEDTGDLDYFEFNNTELNSIEKYENLCVMDVNVMKLIKENFDNNQLACIASEMGIAFGTNKELGNYISKSEETARNLKKETVDKLKTLLEDISKNESNYVENEDLEIFSVHFAETLKRYVSDLFKGDV